MNDVEMVRRSSLHTNTTESELENEGMSCAPGLADSDEELVVSFRRRVEEIYEKDRKTFLVVIFDQHIEVLYAFCQGNFLLFRKSIRKQNQLTATTSQLLFKKVRSSRRSPSRPWNGETFRSMNRYLEFLKQNQVFCS